MEASEDRPPQRSPYIVRRGRPLGLRGSFDVVLEDGTEARIDGEGPVDLPLGYHTIATGRDGDTALIVSPGACYLPDDLRGWGWAAQLYSVHSGNSWGIGDLGDLMKLGRWARTEGASMLLLNPLHAAAPTQPSPYFPTSRSFRNPIYLDVARVARDLDAAIDDPALTSSPTVDRPTVYAAKVAALSSVWQSSDRDPEFERFRLDSGEALARFGTYMTIAEEHGWDTAEWPLGFAHPDATYVGTWRAEHEDRALFHEWLQWLLFRQLSEAEQTIDVIHDLAIGVDPGGADAWVWKDSFAEGVTIGAPPDELAISGQNWAMPPFNPWSLREGGYEPFIQTVRAGLAIGAGLRVDHVMGLFRLWWIPEGADARDGAYVRYPKDDLLNILALESQRARSFVIGEDLGTVEHSVREEMEARNMMSYRVMWFEPSPPKHFPELALACVTNHDLPTVAGLWTGDDLKEQAEIGLETDEEADAILRGRLRERAGAEEDTGVEEVIEGAYEALGEAPSRIKIATLEDATAMRRRPNQPGTTEERPNWSLRLPLSIEELERAPLARRIARALRD
jgi:4-alpha-glucanotransferase